jgi:FkbM family methyltransferase
MGIVNFVESFARHPVVRAQPLAAAMRIARWQLGARVLSGPMVIDWVDGAKLVVSRGMAGATGNLYYGLHEFADMAFALHFLREGDLFLDVGANVGSYSVLATTRGAMAIAFEPIASTYRKLQVNAALNHKIRTWQAAVGSARGKLRMTSGLDSMNRVAESGDVEVPVVTLDEQDTGHVRLIKIDVEGHEQAVLDGARETLKRTDAVIVEMNDVGSLSSTLRDAGFTLVSYSPMRRELRPVSKSGANGIWVRDVETASQQCKEARAFEVYGLRV